MSIIRRNIPRQGCDGTVKYEIYGPQQSGWFLAAYNIDPEFMHKLATSPNALELDDLSSQETMKTWASQIGELFRVTDPVISRWPIMTLASDIKEPQLLYLRSVHFCFFRIMLGTIWDGAEYAYTPHARQCYHRRRGPQLLLGSAGRKKVKGTRERPLNRWSSTGSI